MNAALEEWAFTGREQVHYPQQTQWNLGLELSHEATNWAVKTRGLKPITKIVLWHLADCHNPAAGCFPTQSYLAERAEVSRSSVNRQLDELERLGLIRREASVDPKTKRQAVTRYRLAFEEGFDPLPIGEPCPNVDMIRVPEIDGAVSQKSTEPCPTAGTLREPVTITSKGEPTRTREALRKEFDHNIWAEFPRNPGSDKAKAFDAYLRLSPDDRVQCMRGVSRVAIRFESDRSDEPLERRLKFHIHLAKWISIRAWEQELAPA